MIQDNLVTVPQTETLEPLVFRISTVQWMMCYNLFVPRKASVGISLVYMCPMYSLNWYLEVHTVCVVQNTDR